MTEKDLITKYVPSYINPGNPSSLAQVSTFSAYQIVDGPEGVYGLMHDARLEISTLLKYLGTIDETLDESHPVKKYRNSKYTTYQEYFSDNPKLTIHEYYEEVKRRITEADKNEAK